MPTHRAPSNDSDSVCVCAFFRFLSHSMITERLTRSVRIDNCLVFDFPLIVHISVGLSSTVCFTHIRRCLSFGAHRHWMVSSVIIITHELSDEQTPLRHPNRFKWSCDGKIHIMTFCCVCVRGVTSSTPTTIAMASSYSINNVRKYSIGHAPTSIGRSLFPTRRTMIATA